MPGEVNITQIPFLTSTFRPYFPPKFDRASTYLHKKKTNPKPKENPENATNQPKPKNNNKETPHQSPLKTQYFQEHFPPALFVTWQVSPVVSSPILQIMWATPYFSTISEVCHYPFITIGTTSFSLHSLSYGSSAPFTSVNIMATTAIIYIRN